jgi:DegV family protein with EDD domain
MRIAIVSDSTADIPTEIATEKSIVIVPANLVIDGQTYKDGSGMTRSQFYERIPKMKTLPTTSTPSIGSFLEVYDELLNGGHEYVLSIHVSSVLSSIFSTATMASKEFNDRVSVVDSGQLSLGLGFQVLAASEVAESGCNLDQVIKTVEHIKKRIRVIAMLDTLEYVRRSGRVSWARTRIGNLLQIKPFLEVKDGNVYNRGQVRTRQKGKERLISIIRNLGPIEKLAILHTNAKSEAYKILDVLNLSLDEKPLVVNVTTIVGTHVGPNGLGCAVVLRK